MTPVGSHKMFVIQGLKLKQKYSHDFVARNENLVESSQF